MSAPLSVSPDLLAPAPAAPALATGYGPLDAAKRAKIAKTAQDFEASFTSVMLGEMFQGTDAEAPFGGGEGEGMFKSFLTDAMSRAMAKSGGIGVSAMIQKELLKMQGLSPTPAAAGAAAAAVSASAPASQGAAA